VLVTRELVTAALLGLALARKKREVRGRALLGLVPWCGWCGW
jgi:hypothetical protein